MFSAKASILLLVFLMIAQPVSGNFTGSAEATEDGSFGRLPLLFIENLGQLAEDVAYYMPGSDKTLYFTSGGVTFVSAGENTDRWVTKLDFVGADPEVAPMGEAKREAVFSYFRGRPEDWKTGAASYSKIRYPNLWPGIDLVYSGGKDRLKYEFVVNPGADPEAIQLSYRGITALSLKKTGELAVETPSGGFLDGRPYAYQESAGDKVEIPMKYRLSEKTEKHGYRYSFEIGDYDPSVQLVLDPVIPLYCGYIGGNDADYGWAIAIDEHGCVYVTGRTESDQTSFPVTVGPDLTFNGGYRGDAFVAKLDSTGSNLLYCGYIGGDDSDYGYGIAVDNQGNAFITGETWSDEASFPVFKGPGLIHGGGGVDAFVAMVHFTGTSLWYCGYIGGGWSDTGRGIAVDYLANAYVTGFTSSDHSSFPVLWGPDSTYNGGTDAFVAKIEHNTGQLSYCGYIGGSGFDDGAGIAVDGNKGAYIIGTTRSTESSFPVKTGPDQEFNGYEDAFIAKVDPTGYDLEYCGYIGGGDYETGWGVAVDGYGNAYVTGFTESDESSFPVVTGPDLEHNGYNDVFVAKVSFTGEDLVYCGYIGGDNDDYGNDIAVDETGQAHITGKTRSGQETFPVYRGPDLTQNGGIDAFIAKVNPSGNGLTYCGYIGGSGKDEGCAVAVYGRSYTYIVGTTESTESSFPVLAGPDSTYNGGSKDAFAARIQDYLSLEVSPDPPIEGETATFTIRNGRKEDQTWLAYSVTGPGHAYIPALDVTLGLSAPKKAAGPNLTDEYGDLTWSLMIPGGSAGHDIWIQGVQYGMATNVLATTIEHD